MLFPEILKEERIKANLKQTELGEKVDLSLKAISMYETGQREPKLNTLIALADFFDVSIDYLVGREQPNQSQTIYEEEHLLQMFRALSDDNKEKVIAITKTLHDLDKKSNAEAVG